MPKATMIIHIPNLRYTPEELLEKHEGFWMAAVPIDNSDDVFLVALATEPSPLYSYFADHVEEYPIITFRKIMRDPGVVKERVALSPFGIFPEVKE